MGSIFVGIGGWNYDDWRGRFYPDGLPQKRELEYASRQLTAIEINSTYYGSQKPASFIKWREETPEGFVFAVKGPRFTTNRRELATAGESVDRFFASGVMELGDRLGPVNWQFAEHKQFDADDFARFLDLLPPEIEGRKIRHAVEVRHDSFATPAFVDLCRERGIAIVLSADSEFPMIADATTDFAYLRIMGTQEGEAAGYSPADLDLWAARARALAEGRPAEGLAPVVPGEAPPREVFLFVISGHKVANPDAAKEIIRRL